MRAPRLAAAGCLAALAAACADSTSPTLRPASLVRVAGSGQQDTIGASLRDPLAVRVLNASGAPVAGVPVEWKADEGVGSVVPARGATGPDGVARAAWTLGSAVGNRVVRASVAGVEPLPFEALVRPGAVARVVAAPRSVTLRSPGDSVRFSAELTDRAGNRTQDSVLRWATLDPTVAAVSGAGVAQARAEGNARLVVASGDRADTVAVVVERSVTQENTELGTGDWFTPRQDRAAAKDLAMWASPYAAGAGDSLDVYLHAGAPGAVSVAVYRIGWYGSLGGKRVWRRDGVAAEPQPACTAPDPGPVECPWRRALRIPVSASWTSGVYLIKATDAAGRSTAYPVVIRGRTAAAFTVVIPQFTWQAYNTFGGASLYTSPSGKPGTRVSFERPYDMYGGATYLYSVGYSNELSAIRWLERTQRDVNYVSDLDLRGGGAAFIPPTRGLIFAGHDEYWTWGEYDTVERLRDAGKHLMFLAGNNAYWNVRLGDGAVTGRAAHRITCFKLAPDPEARSASETTTLFRNAPLNRPENALYGIMFSMWTSSSARAPLVAVDPAGAEGRQFLQAAGLQPGATLPGLVGLEGDQVVSNGKTPSNLQILFRSPFIPGSGQPSGEYYTTFFVSPSGAGVFAGGNNEFARGLDGFAATESGLPSDERPELQRLIAAVLDWMAAR